MSMYTSIRAITEANQLLFFSEIREFNPNVKKRARDVTKDLEINGLIDWNQLVYFKTGKLNRITASDACCKFEYLIMNDTTAVIVEDDN